MRASSTVVGTILLGFLAVAVAAYETGASRGTTLALFAAAIILTELLEETEGSRAREPVPSEPFRIVSALHIAAVLVLGVWPAVLLAGACALVVKRLRSSDWLRVSFGASAFALAALAGGWAFGLTGGRTGHLVLLDDVVPLALLAVAYLTVRTLLLELVHAREVFQPDLVAAAAEAGLGAAIALIAAAHAWNVVVLLPLALVIREAHLRMGRVRRETLHALETFANIVDERDSSTYQHSARVARYVDGLARALGLPFSDIDRLRWAGRLHDLGKVAVDASVLRKEGGLDPAEWAAMRRSPRLSARLLQRFEFAAAQARAVEYHHERYDGNGYYGIAGADLPLASHFLIVADSFDAMTTDRPFRPALTREEALAEIELGSGTQFHPAIAKAFVAVQRGKDPAEVLTADELAELRDATLPHRFPTLPRASDFLDRPELIALGGVCVALVAAGLRLTPLIVSGVSLAVLGFALRALRQIRMRRLLGALTELLARASVREDTFERLYELLARTSGASWAGLLAWHEDGLGGSLELERGSDAPARQPLLSWLLGVFESGEELVVSDGHELRSERTFVAVPLRRDNSALVGFFVVALPSRLPRHVDLALRASVEQLAPALGPSPAATTPGARLTRPVAARLASL